MFETKTLLKPVRGDIRVTFDGEQILESRMRSDRDPNMQSGLQAKWLGDML